MPSVTYPYATNSWNINIQATSYEKGTAWTLLNGLNALPDAGGWATVNSTWVPDVIDRGDGAFAMYYATESFSQQTTALELRLQQTFWDPTHNGRDPLLARQREVVPSIQLGSKMPMANVILFTKSTGAALVEGVPVESRMKNTPPRSRCCQMMEEDALPPTGDPVQILDRGPQDGPLVEAPVLILRNGI